MKPGLQLRVKPAVQLRLTPQVKLSLAILQKPVLELKNAVDQALTENPFLEAQGSPERELSIEQMTESASHIEEKGLEPEHDESAVDALQERINYFASLYTSPPSLQEELRKQFRIAFVSPEELKIGDVILGCLNSHGYLAVPLGEIALTLGIKEEAVQRILEVIQTFEPAGVGARELKECLLIQLKAKGREGSHAWRIVRDCFNDLSKQRFERIAKQMGTSSEDTQKAVREILALDPKPGRAFGASAQPIVPDLAVEKVDGRLEVECLNGYLPKLKVRKEYRSLLRSKDSDASTEKLKQLYADALGLVRALQYREKTIERLAKALLKEQAEFFEKGPEHLKPLTARELAQRLGCHESTVSRAIAEKYIATPFGVFPMAELFPKRVELAAGGDHLVKQLEQFVQEALSQEDKPLTDREIADTLQAKGIAIARRTVAKYRERIKVLPARLRKKAAKFFSKETQ